MDKPVKVLFAGIARYFGDYNRVVSLGVACLKAYVDSQFSADAVQAKTVNILDNNTAYLLSEIKQFAPDIIGFSCFLWNVDFIINVCRELKKNNPSIKIFLGGPEATGRRISLLKDCSADAVIIGEGEGPVKDIIERFIQHKDWNGIRGVILPSYTDEQSEKELPQILPLEMLPSPYLSKNALGTAMQSKMFYPFETMRGCPNRCSYCMWTTLGSKSVRYFPIERIKAELEWMTENTPDTYIFVADSDTFANRERAMSLAPLFLKAADEGRLKFIFQTNLKSWNKELMQAYNHPSVELNVGINTLNPKVQQLFGRVYTKEFVEENLRKLYEYAPRTKVLIQMMYACPKETFADFCAFFDWAWSIPYFDKMFFHTQLLSGSRISGMRKELKLTSRKKPPFYITSTAECNEQEIKTEEIMILCTAIWMCNPHTAPILRRFVNEHCNKSFSLAFLKVWTSLSAKEHNLILEFLSYLDSGKDRLMDDFQLDVLHDFFSEKNPNLQALFNSTNRRAYYSYTISSYLEKFCRRFI